MTQAMSRGGGNGTRRALMGVAGGGALGALGMLAACGAPGGGESGGAGPGAAPATLSGQLTWYMRAGAGSCPGSRRRWPPLRGRPRG